MKLIDELKRRNVIRVAIAYIVSAWFVLQVSDLVLEHTGAPSWVFQSLALLLAIGLPVVLVFAWAFEITPDGIKRERDVERSDAGQEQSARKLDMVTIAVVVLLAGFMLVDRFVLEPTTVSKNGLQDAAREDAAASVTDPGTVTSDVAPSQPLDTSIAVLPFVAMSRGEDDEYFADGLTEEIINSLATLPELLVTARTSAFFFKGKDLPVPEIARQLGVAHLVEGSVRRAGDRLRITAQVIRADDGFHLWSQTYDRGIQDVFAVQEDIAVNIASILDVVLDGQKRAAMREAGINNVDAFIAMQRARAAFVAAHANIAATTELLREVTPLFDQVLAVAPDMVAARILRVDASAHVLFDNATGMQGGPSAEEAATALAELHEQYALAWEYSVPGSQRDVLAVEQAIFEDDWTGLKAKLERASRPGDCVATNWTLELAMSLGYIQEVLTKVNDKLRCDPLDPLTNAHLANALIHAGRAGEALTHLDEAENRGLEFEWLEDLRLYALLALGRLDEAGVKAASGTGAWINFPREILVYSLRGQQQQAEQLANEVWSNPTADDWVTLVSAAVVGDREMANEAAGRIDSHVGSSVVLNNATYICMCGRPFDLEATPNYARRLSQAGFAWNPPAPLKFPAKDW
ncbi:MAG TPA: hypothetical protein VFG52_00130 [Xanthomonadales bacterium]|nr:hypothetical protein [Xanthomonadales bacterium]